MAEGAIPIPQPGTVIRPLLPYERDIQALRSEILAALAQLDDRLQTIEARLAHQRHVLPR